jgi:hypothetical protein
MKRTRRFPTRLVRCISLCVSFALLLSFLAIVPVRRNGTSFAQGQGSPNGQGTRVPAPPPVVGPPATDLPNIDAVRRRPNDPPETPPHLPSIIRSRRNPIEPRNGRKVGDPGTTLIGSGYGTRSYGTPTSRGSDRVRSGTGVSPATQAQNAPVSAESLKVRASALSKLTKFHHRREAAIGNRKSEMLAPSPIGDDQYVQNFFSYALTRQPYSNEQLYWDDILRAGYAKGQTSMVMAAPELGKTLFESSEYAARARND